MTAHDRAEQLLDRDQRTAILLREPYPPPAPAEAGNSYFGGLPRLPEGFDWPYLDAEVPLHFLAQIDCSELPGNDLLPDRGVLFFFAWDNDEQNWDGVPWADETADTASQVIYAPGASRETAFRAAPAGLPPIGGDCPSPHARPFVMRGEPGPNVHPWWPVVPTAIPNWPNPDAMTREDLTIEPSGAFSSFTRMFQRADTPTQASGQRAAVLEQYRALFEERYAAAYREAAGTVHRKPTEILDFDGFASTYWGDAGEAGAFPSRWLEVSLFARAVRAKTNGIMQVARAKEVAEEWLARAAAEADDASVVDSDRAAFRAWVEGWRNPASKYQFHMDASRILADVGREMVRRDAFDPGRLVSPHGYEVLAPLFALNLPDRSSQMLGYPPTTQRSLDASEDAICLLQLGSYSAVGWMFADMGEGSFWIKRGDLSRQDFRKAWARVEGG